MDFKDDTIELETAGPRGSGKLLAQKLVADFDRPTADRADEELAAMIVQRMTAGGVGIQGLDPVDEPVIDPEVQGPVDDRGHDPGPGIRQRRQQIVGFHGHIAGCYQTQDIAPPPGQAQTMLAAILPGRREDPL